MQEKSKFSKRTFNQANKQSEQKYNKTYKIYPDSYKSKIKNIIKTEENKNDEQYHKEELENEKKRYLTNEKRVKSFFLFSKFS